MNGSPVVASYHCTDPSLPLQQLLFESCSYIYSHPFNDFKWLLNILCFIFLFQIIKMYYHTCHREKKSVLLYGWLHMCCIWTFSPDHYSLIQHSQGWKKKIWARTWNIENFLHHEDDSVTYQYCLQFSLLPVMLFIKLIFFSLKNLILLLINCIFYFFSFSFWDSKYFLVPMVP